MATISQLPRWKTLPSNDRNSYIWQVSCWVMALLFLRAIFSWCLCDGQPFPPKVSSFINNSPLASIGEDTEHRYVLRREEGMSSLSPLGKAPALLFWIFTSHDLYLESYVHYSNEIHISCHWYKHLSSQFSFFLPVRGGKPMALANIIWSRTTDKLRPNSLGEQVDSLSNYLSFCIL